jgi:hypothetical protein
MADCFALLANIENDLLEGFEASMQYLESFDVTKMVEAIYDMIDRNLTICKVLVFGKQTRWTGIEVVITALTRNPHGSISAPSTQIRMESGFAAHPSAAVFRKR